MRCRTELCSKRILSISPSKPGRFSPILARTLGRCHAVLFEVLVPKTSFASNIRRRLRESYATCKLTNVCFIFDIASRLEVFAIRLEAIAFSSSKEHCFYSSRLESARNAEVTPTRNSLSWNWKRECRVRPYGRINLSRGRQGSWEIQISHVDQPHDTFPGSPPLVLSLFMSIPLLEPIFRYR